MRKHSVTLNDRELAAVWAGLRFLQNRLDGRGSDEEVWEIYTDESSSGGLNSEQIDNLCERLNKG